jgi:hypothetical protein
MFFDPLYFVFLLPGMALAGLASLWMKSAYAKALRIPTRRGITGAQAAHSILQANGLHHVNVEMTQGRLGDHYDPRKKVLRLSPDVYNGHSVAAVGIAAHEAGHALQDADRYAPLVLRNGIVPLANTGSNMAFVLLFAGVLLQSTGMMLTACVAFAAVVLFQLINLPVEFNASARAKRVLVAHHIVDEQEEREVSKVLTAAAMTYVAATATAILQLLYFLMRAGVLGGSRD